METIQNNSDCGYDNSEWEQIFPYLNRIEVSIILFRYIGKDLDDIASMIGVSKNTAYKMNRNVKLKVALIMSRK